MRLRGPTKATRVSSLASSGQDAPLVLARVAVWSSFVAPESHVPPVQDALPVALPEQADWVEQSDVPPVQNALPVALPEQAG